MEFLYGDSTPSTLKTNFLELLRDALGLCAFFLQSDERIQRGLGRAAALKQASEEEAARLEAYVATVVEAIARVPTSDPDSPTAACAEALTTLAAETLAQGLTAVRTMLTTETTAIEAEENSARQACFQSLQSFLLAHDPPQSRITHRVELLATGYEAGLTGESEFSLAWRVKLAIPEHHLWSTRARLERIVPGVEIKTPQISGWLSKEVKVRAQKLERLWMTDVSDDGEAVRLRLRSEPGVESGFDLVVRLAEQQLEMVKVGASDDISVGPFEVQPEDVPRLLELADKLRASLRELTREQLLAATFQKVHIEQLPRFDALVHELVLAMTPTVRDIAQRSVTPNELVLRRQLGNDRREEIFVSKASLRERYAALDESRRAIFMPLGLEPGSIPASMMRPGDATLEALPAIPESVPVPSRSAQRPDELVAALKAILNMVKQGRIDEGYAAYEALFVSPEFAGYRPEDQRQALRLMVLAKSPPPTTDAVLSAHRAALVRLEELVDALRDPVDYELLGVTHVLLGDNGAASRAFGSGLAVERERDPQSELCGTLMRRVASV